MNKRYSESLWSIFRRIYPKRYSLSPKDAPVLMKEETGVPFPLIGSGSGGIEAFQSHSTRAAWVRSPWQDRGVWYSGFEYKGIGESGGPIRRMDRSIIGGVVKSAAIREHEFAKRAFDGGVLCQRPLGIYEYGMFSGTPLAVVVRTFISPLPLSDFLFEKELFDEFLGLRGESRGEYSHFLASRLGGSVRRLFDLGLYHGTLGINNITTEGELADFEPTDGGTWEGLAYLTDPFMRFIALRRVLFAGKTMFPDHAQAFYDDFASAFFGQRTKSEREEPAKGIAERYCRAPVRYRMVNPADDPEDRLYQAVKQVEMLRDESEDPEERRRYDYVISTLRMPSPVRLEEDGV